MGKKDLNFEHQGDGYDFLAAEVTENGAKRDWYVCVSPDGNRDLFCRVGEGAPEYSSCTIGSTVTPTTLELSAYVRGFKFTQEELAEFGHRYLEEKLQKMSVDQLARFMPAWEDESLLGPMNKRCDRCFSRNSMLAGNDVHEGYDGFPVCQECGEV